MVRRRAGGHALRGPIVGRGRGQRGALLRRRPRYAAQRRARSADRGGAGVPALGGIGSGARIPGGARHRPTMTRASPCSSSRWCRPMTSGVAFTVNPVTGADELVVNAGRGLGEALVSGQIDPDEFRIRKRDATVLSARPGARPATGGAPDAVAVATRRARRHPDADRAALRRAAGRRVVPRRPAVLDRAVASGDDVARRCNRRSHCNCPIPNGPGRTWRRCCPIRCRRRRSPSIVDLLDRGEREFFGRLMAPESELGPIIKAFHGRLYFNLSQLRHVTETVGAAPADTLRSFGHSEADPPGRRSREAAAAAPAAARAPGSAAADLQHAAAWRACSGAPRSSTERDPRAAAGRSADALGADDRRDLRLVAGDRARDA